MAKRKTVTVNLALQGGGAHGAFTWGVLDRLLEETWIDIEGITATSAGAMNAAAFKVGWINGKRDGAKKALDEFWHEIGGLGALLPDPLKDWFLTAAPPLSVLNNIAELNAHLAASSQLTQIFSPYDNPFYRHPLEPVVRAFDYTCVCADEGPKLFVSATRVSNGKIRVFKGEEVTPEAILASACLPTLYRAIEIFDTETDQVEAFWDGGYMGNPALFPLYYHTEPEDVLIVHINPLSRDGIPKSVRDIQNRVNEISFNSSLFRELRALEFVKKLLRDGKLKPGEMKDVKVHSISDDETMRQLSAATKLTPTPALLGTLKDAGRAAFELFLAENGDKIGKESTSKVHEMINF